MTDKPKKITVLLIAVIMISLMLSLIPASQARAEEEDTEPPAILINGWPEDNSMAYGETVHFTIYFYDHSGISSVTMNAIPLTEESNPPVVKDGDKLWHVDFEYKDNVQVPGFAAYDPNTQIPSMSYAKSLKCFSESPDHSLAKPMLTQKDLILIDENGVEYNLGSSIPSKAYVVLNYVLESGDTVEVNKIKEEYGDFEKIESENIGGRVCYPITAGYYELILKNNDEFVTRIMFAYDDYAQPEYEWDGTTSVTATTHSNLNPEKIVTETAEVTSQITKEPTCEEKGETTYSATFENDVFVKQEKTIADIEPLGHDWGDPQYEWGANYATATAARKCKHDATHIDSETVIPSSVIAKQPTCTERGEVTYTATFKNEAFVQQVITADTIPADGHDWGMPTYEWATNNASVTATVICKTDPTHKITETAGVKKTVLTEETCTEEGEVVYTASFRNTEFTAQSKVVTIGALGHSYGEATYTWSEDNSTVTAQRVCTRDESHVETETVVTTRTVTKEATVTEDGEAVITATFQNGAFLQQTKTVKIPALGYGTYRLVSGGDSTYSLGSNTSLQFIFSRTSNDETSVYHFQGLKIDDVTVDSVYYVVRSGSVIVDISGVYLETLSNGDHTLTAMFDDGNDVIAMFKVSGGSGTVVTYKVVFNANGHGDWPDTQTVQSGKMAVRPQDPKADGYVFGGWYIDSACTVAFNFNNAITANTTLYAKWTMSGSTPGGTDNTSSYSNTDKTPTGDDSITLLWAGLMLVSLIGAAAIVTAAKKERKQN